MYIPSLAQALLDLSPKLQLARVELEDLLTIAENNPTELSSLMPYIREVRVKLQTLLQLKAGFEFQLPRQN